MRLWNVLTGEHLATLDHKSPVLSLAFGPGDSLLASGSADGNARLWDLAGELLATLGHESPVRSVAFSPDGGLLVSGAEDGKVRQWQVTSVASCCPRNPANDFNTLREPLVTTPPAASGRTAPPCGWRISGMESFTPTTWPPEPATPTRTSTPWMPLETTIPAASGRTALTMWVADDFDDKLYAYDLNTKARDPRKDFNTLDAAGNNAIPRPSGPTAPPCGWRTISTTSCTPTT